MTKISTIVLKKDRQIEEAPELKDFNWISFSNSEFDSDQIVIDPHRNEVDPHYTNIPNEKLKELLETGETSYLLVEVTYVNHKLNSL